MRQVTMKPDDTAVRAGHGPTCLNLNNIRPMPAKIGAARLLTSPAGSENLTPQRDSKSFGISSQISASARQMDADNRAIFLISIFTQSHRPVHQSPQ